MQTMKANLERVWGVRKDLNGQWIVEGKSVVGGETLIVCVSSDERAARATWFSLASEGEAPVCAWCMHEYGASSWMFRNQSHGICQHHKRQVLATFNGAKQKVKV